jgi:hypothetical protein
MKNRHMVSFFAVQDSRRTERPCPHGHHMATFFAALSSVLNKMTMYIAHGTFMMRARMHTRELSHDSQNSWSFVERYSIIAGKTRPCYDHVHMVTYTGNEDNTIKNMTMSLFSFFLIPIGGEV